VSGTAAACPRATPAPGTMTAAAKARKAATAAAAPATAALVEARNWHRER
jgi:hypothetical protein